jgi:hypothetical protein
MREDVAHDARVGAGTPAPDGMRFTPRAGLEAEPLPGAMKKVLLHRAGQRLGLEAGPRREAHAVGRRGAGADPGEDPSMRAGSGCPASCATSSRISRSN